MSGWTVFVIVGWIAVAIMVIVSVIFRWKTERVTQHFIDDMLRARFLRNARLRKRGNRR